MKILLMLFHYMFYEYKIGVELIWEYKILDYIPNKNKDSAIIRVGYIGFRHVYGGSACPN